MDRRARKAADRLRRRGAAGRRAARQHLDPGVRRARCARAARCAGRAARARIALDDYFEGILEPSVIDGQTVRRSRGTSKRACCTTGATCCAQAGFDAPPHDLGRMDAACSARSRRWSAPERYAVLLPLNEFEPLLDLAVQQPSELLRDDGRYGNFRSAEFQAHAGVLREHVRASWAPRMTNTQISNVWDEFGRGILLLLHHRALEHRRVQKRLPPTLRDDWMTVPMPGPNGPGASIAGGASFVIFKHSQNKDAAWQLIEYLSQPALQQRFYELTGDLPPRRSTWQTPALANDRLRAGVPRRSSNALRSPPKVPEWERIARRCAWRPSASCSGVADASTQACDRARPQDRRDPREAPLDDGPPHAARGCAMRAASLAGWWFVAPALIVIGVFFFLPVLAALALSLTDFDLYALADFAQPALRRLRQLRRACCASRCSGRRWATRLYFVVLGVPLSIGVSLGAALLVNSKLAQFRGLFRTVYFAPVVTTLVAVAVMWRYIFHTRYGLLNYALALGRHRSDRLDGRSALGDAGDRDPRRVEELRLQHDHLAGGAAGIPEDLYEAARIDGASWLAAVRHVTLPRLGPVLLLVSILTMAGYFQLFAEPYVMTEGGPLQST